MPPSHQPSLRVAIVYASLHRGNTRRVAEAIAETLHADLFRAEELDASKLTEYESVGFGSGIYYGRHHRSVRVLANKVSGGGRIAFIFSTAGLPFLSRLFHWSLRRRLLRRGWRIVGEFTCRGWDKWGPLMLVGGLNRNHPDERDLERARDFTRRLMRRHGKPPHEAAQ